MTDDNDLHHACGDHADQLAELALGILTGRERAATLAHVEGCPRCADELEHLARTADALVSVAPEIEPPMGFEVRLFSRIGVSVPAPRRWGRVPARMLAAAAVVAALGLGLGLGLTSGSAPMPSATAALASADLVEQGHTVGHVTLYGGSRPWVLMTMADSGVRGTVTCKLVMADGTVVTVGQFTAHHGYGAWGTPLHVPATSVRTAEVVSASGAVIATAPLD